MNAYLLLKTIHILSSTLLFDKNDPLSPTNRRISIIVLNKRAEEALLQGDGHASLDVDSESVDELPSLSPPAGGKN